MITIENADKALKDYYLEAVTAQLNDTISPFFSAIEKTADYVYGNEVKLNVVRGYSGHVKACAEDAALPDPYSNRYLGISAPLKNLYGTIEISDKALRASRDGTGAFVNLVNAEMEGLVSSARQNFSRMLYGDGNGVLCKIVEASGSDVTVDMVKDFFVGMQVDLYTSLGNLDAETTGLTITKIDKANKTITVDAEVEVPVDDGTVRVHGATGNELMGLSAIFGGDTLYGYKKAEEPYFSPYSVKLSSGLTEDAMTDVIDYLEENFNSKVNMILCSYSTRKKIAALIADKKRVVNSIDAKTGIGVVSVNDIPVYADKYCPEGTIYFVNTGDFVLNQLCDWEWLEDDGGRILKQIPGKAAFGATLVKYAELICKKPCGQAVMTGV